MSKLEEIAGRLRRDLAAGKYPVGSRFPSEYELAEQLGVHKITANKAVSLLANEGLLVRGKRGSGTRVVCQSVFPCGHLVFIVALGHNYTLDILNGAQLTALNRNYLVSVIAPPFEELNSYLNRLPGSAVKGILTADYGLLPSNLPVIYLDYEFSSSETIYHSVNCDNYQGGKLMMRQLIDRGHRNIVIYSRGGNLLHRQKRLQGFYDVMAAADITDFKNRTFLGLFNSLEDSVHNLKQILKRFPGITAIVTDSDNDAMEMIKAATKLGLDFPRQLTVTGFGNVKSISNYFPVPTIEQNFLRMGAVACDHLINIIENGAPDPCVREQIEVELINPEFIPRITPSKT